MKRGINYETNGYKDRRRDGWTEMRRWNVEPEKFNSSRSRGRTGGERERDAPLARPGNKSRVVSVARCRSRQNNLNFTRSSARRAFGFNYSGESAETRRVGDERDIRARATM